MHSQSTNWRIPERPEANPSVEKTRAWSLPQVLVSLQDSWSSLQQTLDGHLRMLVAVFSGYIYVRLTLDNIRCRDAVIDHLVFLIILGSRQANMFARKIELAIAKVVTSCPAHGRLPPANNGASKHINFCNWATWPNAKYAKQIHGRIRSTFKKQAHSMMMNTWNICDPISFLQPKLLRNPDAGPGASENVGANHAEIWACKATGTCQTMLPASLGKATNRNQGIQYTMTTVIHQKLYLQTVWKWRCK